jgi:hypothetical protein
MREVDGVQGFCVALAQAWLLESELGGARELVDEFKAYNVVGCNAILSEQVQSQDLNNPHANHRPGHKCSVFKPQVM